MMAPVEAVTASAPGRVNLIGEHLDYNGGRCLPIALPQRTTVTARPSRDGQLTVTSGGLTWSGLPTERADGWAAYVVGVLWALGTRTALDLTVTSEVPMGAGLASSAALECATALAVDRLLGLGLSRDALVAACVRAETEYVGAPTGGLDQTTALFATPARALLLDFAETSRRPLPWRPEDDGVALLVVDTKVAHDLVDGGYGDRRAECAEAARLLGVPHLARAASTAGLPGTLAARARHVISEQRRVDEVVDALQERDWSTLGRLMTASHESLRDDFEVSCAELDLAVETVLQNQALGARMTGGGFGGSIIALVPIGRLDDVISFTRAALARNGREPPTSYVVEASAGARVEPAT
jgi:galactokinase